MERSKSICIIGAGIGGLALARALQLKGFACVTVFEKDPSIASRPQGYSLSIQQGGAVLRGLGLGPILDNVKTTNSAFHTLDKNGKTLLYYGEENPFESSSTRSWQINQGLRMALFETLAPNTVIWNKGLESFEFIEPKAEGQPGNGNGPVKVTFSDGETRHFDCLIGCDGIRSKVREILLNDPPEYLGVMSIVGITSTQGHPFIQRRVIQIVDGAGQRVFIKPFDDNTCMWQLTYLKHAEDTLAAERSPESAIDEAKRRLQGWMDPIPDLVARTSPQKIRYAPLWDRTPISPKTGLPNQRLPVTLLGDAMHPMSPFKGQGANQALEDARDLANMIDVGLQSGKQLAETFHKEFVPTMLRRSAPKVLKSRAHVKFYHSSACIDQNEVFAYNHINTEAKRSEMLAAIERADSKNHVNLSNYYLQQQQSVK